MDLFAGNVKAAMKSAGAVSSDLWKVPLAQLRLIDGFNVRSGSEHKEHVAGLVDSILANGFYASKPLSGYVALEGAKQIIYITDGHCRFEAAQEAIKRGAEITVLPVVVSPKGTSIEDLTVGLVTNNSGKPLTPFEVGMVCKRLIGFGMEEKEVARRLILSAQRVADLLALVGAPAAVRKLVTDGVVSATQAISTIKREGDEAPAKLAAGAAKAKAAGKPKATAKHIDARPTCRAVVKALLEWAKNNPERNASLNRVIDLARETQS